MACTGRSGLSAQKPKSEEEPTEKVLWHIFSQHSSLSRQISTYRQRCRCFLNSGRLPPGKEHSSSSSSFCNSAYFVHVPLSPSWGGHREYMHERSGQQFATFPTHSASYCQQNVVSECNRRRINLLPSFAHATGLTRCCASMYQLTRTLKSIED